MGMRIFTRIAICLLVLAGAGTALYLLSVSPTVKKDAELATQITDRERALSDLQKSTAGIDDVNRKINELQQAVQFFESKLPQEKEVETVLEQVWKLAEANSLQAKTIKSGKTERTSNYSEQQIEMNLAGDFNGFYLFMQQLERMPRLTRVPEMVLTKISDHEGDMQAKLTLSIFFEPSDSTATASAAQ